MKLGKRKFQSLHKVCHLHNQAPSVLDYDRFDSGRSKYDAAFQIIFQTSRNRPRTPGKIVEIKVLAYNSVITMKLHQLPFLSQIQVGYEIIILECRMLVMKI